MLEDLDSMVEKLEELGDRLNRKTPYVAKKQWNWILKLFFRSVVWSVFKWKESDGTRIVVNAQWSIVGNNARNRVVVKTYGKGLLGWFKRKKLVIPDLKMYADEFLNLMAMLDNKRIDASNRKRLEKDDKILKDGLRKIDGLLDSLR